MEIDPTSHIGMLVDILDKELKELIKEYGEAKNRYKGADEIELNRYKQRIAAKACDLLFIGENILKRHIPDYDSLRNFFCNLTTVKP